MLLMGISGATVPINLYLYHISWPTFKGRHYSKSLLFHHTLYQLYSAATNFIQYSANGSENNYRDINFETLFPLCTNTQLAKSLHARVIVLGGAHSVFVSTRLVNLYANLGDVTMSRCTFDHIPRKNVYTWNSMMSSYVRNGRYSDAVKCFYDMLQKSRVRADFYTFPAVLKACHNLVDGKRIHSWVFKLGFQWDVFVAASLVHMYCKFGSFRVAHEIFDGMPFRDLGCWNAIVSGFCQNGNVEEALKVLDEMRLEGVKMDPVTVSTILPFCAQLNDIVRGMLTHLYAIKHGLDGDLFVGNALINMYAKFGELGHAQEVFDEMAVRDLVSWNSIIAAYEQNAKPDIALEFFGKMQLDGNQPDLLTLVSIASSIAQSGDSRSSRCIHGFLVRGLWVTEDVIVGNAVVDMYAKLGMIDSASKFFKNIPFKDTVSWNTMITGYTQNGLASEAIEVYNKMGDCKDITRDRGTWVSILPAYAHVGALKEGMRTHGRVLKSGLIMDVFVGTCLIDLYGKCGEVVDAMSLFHEVPRVSSFSWNVIISCLGVHGYGEKCLQLFRYMRDEGVKPDHITFVSLLAACSHSGLVDEGRWCFDVMQQEYGIKPSLKHYGSMVDLLGRAGKLDMAYEFIESMPLQPDASVWGALLGSCRIHGNVEMGKLASDRLLEVDPENVGYYVLISNIYATVGKWEGVNRVRSLAREKGLRKTPGWSSIELNNKIEVFYTGNQSHPKCDEIYEELETLTARIKILGYVPDLSFVLQDVEEDEKQHILTSHSERLAIAYGIISTSPKTPIRIFKNLRVCGDCHNATKFISKVTEREIIVRDSNRFHHFKDGTCSCGDFW